MAIIPDGQKINTIDESVPTGEKRSSQNNSLSEYYSIADLKDTILGYKVYSGLFTQAGTDAPVVTVLENTIGDIVWSRDTLGNYRGTLIGAFTAGKSTFNGMTSFAGNSTKMETFNDLSGNITYMYGDIFDTGFVTFSTRDDSPGGGAPVEYSTAIGTSTYFIEIRVYN